MDVGLSLLRDNSAITVVPLIAPEHRGWKYAESLPLGYN